jgi:2-polyprenyl-3-methyl-5-hydroxy-6-metoxy-1,4-benzoquinol methylase
MTEIEALSVTDSAEFTEIWYDIANDDHFWIKWRLRELLKELAVTGIDVRSPARCLDIGCGHGTMLRRLSRETAWNIDGCDLNRAALAKSANHNGRVMFYDINDRHAALREHYEYILMMDVLEHIDDPVRFLLSATYHLKPGGFAFVDVPAMKFLYSKYDTVVGHVCRYTREQLHEQLREGGLNVVSSRYWGKTLIPVALLRKLYVDRMSDPDQVMSAGFAPPSTKSSAVLSALAWIDRGFPRCLPFGTSLLAIAEKTRAV